MRKASEGLLLRRCECEGAAVARGEERDGGDEGV